MSMYDVESYGHARPNHTELPTAAIWVLLADRLLTRSGGKGRAGGLRRDAMHEMIQDMDK
jgi:hypothetical protein